MSEMILIGSFGFLGVLLRALLERVSPFVEFPAMTLFINCLGCILAGAIYVLGERSAMGAPLRTGLLIGFCGGLTTFSSYALQAFALAERGRWISGFLYFSLSPVLGFLCVLLTVALMRRMVF